MHLKLSWFHEKFEFLFKFYTWWPSSGFVNVQGIFESYDDVKMNITYRRNETDKPMEKGLQTGKPLMFSDLYRKPEITIKTEKPLKN